MKKNNRKNTSMSEIIYYPCLNTECTNKIPISVPVVSEDVGLAEYILCDKCVLTHECQPLVGEEAREMESWDIFPTTHYKAVKKQ